MALEQRGPVLAGAAFALAFRIVRNREDAEEVVQDAFVKAFGGLAGFRQQSRFATWLYRIVYTTALNRAATHRDPSPPASRSAWGWTGWILRKAHACLSSSR